MTIPPWAWVAGTATILGGLALVSSSSSAAAAPAPTPLPTGPIQITEGHRYQVTLTFGGATNAAALLANVVPNLQAGLNAVAPNEFRFVHAIAPNDTQVVYVVDAIGGAPGSTISESPQTFYADLNAASLGGLSVHVSDLGPSPVGGALPPPPVTTPPAPPPPVANPPPPPPPTSVGPLTIDSLVTDPALVGYAQFALAEMQAPTAAAVPVNGNPNDPATLAAVAAFQQVNLPPAAHTGQLDYFTWALIVALSALTPAGPPGLDAVLTDAPRVTLAQRALARAIALGAYTSIDYGLDQVNGVATDPAWTAALAAAMTQGNAIVGRAIAPVDGTLDYVAFAFVLGTGYTPPSPATGTNIVPVTPGDLVTDAAEVTFCQQRLVALAAVGGTLTPAQSAVLAAVTANGLPTDPATAAAVRLVQSAMGGLQHRTTPGVLDYLTFAFILTTSAELAVPPVRPAVLVSPPVTRAPVVAGAQEALAIALKARLSTVTGVTYTRSEVDANPQNPAWTTALVAVVGALNAQLASTGVSLPTTGVLDYDTFAVLFTVAYL